MDNGTISGSSVQFADGAVLELVVLLGDVGGPDSLGIGVEWEAIPASTLCVGLVLFSALLFLSFHVLHGLGVG